MNIEWISPTHKRTPEETLYALQWCERNKATISYKSRGVCVTLPGRRAPIRAYDLADAVKAAISYGFEA